MSSFYAVVHKDADSAFGVEFPDLSGCFSAADDVEQLVSNAREALELWFEDQPEKITPSRREHIASDLAEGSFLISVPHIGRAS